jgi:hypothetical protein
MADTELNIKNVQVPENASVLSEGFKRVILNLHILHSSGHIVHKRQSQHSKNKLLIFRNIYSYMFVNYG